MKIEDKFYVLQNSGNPVLFLGEDERLKYIGVDTLKKAYKGNKVTMQAILDDYNKETFHSLAPDYHIVKVDVTYEF